MLALQRAAYLYSLQQGVQLRLLSDVFSTMETASNTYEDQRNKMLVLGVIEHPVQHVSYRIEHEYTSIFGEKFLEVSFTPSNDSCDFSYHSISELMLLFTKERVEEEEVKFNLLLESDSCREQSDQSWFQLKGTQSSPQIISYMNGVEICSLQEDCWYEDAGFGGQGGLEKMDMRNAFWNAYMSSLVKALLLYPFSDVNVKQVDDRFNGGTDSGCGLYREKVVAVLSISPFIKDIRNNKLCVDWQITEQQNIIRILSMVVFSLCLPFSLFAQIDKDMKEFDDFVKQQHKEFDDFVSEQNKEFAEFLKETWKEYDLQKPGARPQRPEP